MRPGGGKSKGSQFEREICVALSLWVSHNQREDLFWRSAMSGGRATVGRRKGKDLAQHAGDISATHPAGHALTDVWYVECKRYADLRIESFIFSNVGTLAKFWIEACQQARSHNRIPMLIIRQDRMDTFVIVPANGAHLAQGVAQRASFAPNAHIARLHSRNVDIYDFDGLVAGRFFASGKEFPFRLKPGELQRILKPKAKPRVRVTQNKERVRL